LFPSLKIREDGFTPRQKCRQNYSFLY
jgi:hypothetical protein